MQKHVSRRNVMVTSCALAGALALGLTAGGTAQASDPLRYVALGDSYSAGLECCPWTRVTCCA